MVQERGNVLLKPGNDDRIGKEILETFTASILEVLSRAAERAVGAVPVQGQNQAQPAVVRGFYRIVNVLEGLGVKLAHLRLYAQVAAHAVAHRLRANDAATHGLDGVHGVVHFKLARIARPPGIEGTVSLDAEPLDIRTAITHGVA